MSRRLRVDGDSPPEEVDVFFKALVQRANQRALRLPRRGQPAVGALDDGLLRSLARMEEIGLFPLQLVLLPSERVPLHIFEDRYKELIGEAVASHGEFGLVYADDQGVREVGTRARVAQVITSFPDGRMNVLVEGGERFRLDELTSGRSFHTGLVSALEDDDDPAEPAAIERALQLFERLREVTGSDVDVPAADAAQLSFALAGRVELPPDEKLELLGEVSERRRMERVAELFEAAVTTAEHVRTAAERAASNGRVQLG